MASVVRRPPLRSSKLGDYGAVGIEGRTCAVRPSGVPTNARCPEGGPSVGGVSWSLGLQAPLPGSRGRKARPAGPLTPGHTAHKPGWVTGPDLEKNC